MAIAMGRPGGGRARGVWRFLVTASPGSPALSGSSMAMAASRGGGGRMVSMFRRLGRGHLLMGVLLLSVFLSLGSQEASTQTYPRCITGCTAKDVTLESVWVT